MADHDDQAGLAQAVLADAPVVAELARHESDALAYACRRPESAAQALGMEANGY
jgi:hypothetical protein